MSSNQLIDPFIHSIPLEMDWTNDSPALDAATEEIISKVEFKGHKRNVRKHLRGLLIICARVHRDRPDHYVAYSRGSNFDCKTKYKNPFNFKVRSMKAVVDTLTPRYLDHNLGYNYVGKLPARLSRFRPTETLISLMSNYGLFDLAYQRELINGGIILKDAEDNIVYSYHDTQEIIQMRKNLTEYNNFIGNINIFIDSKETFERGFFESNRVYRIFNSNFERNGRFYGGWWQNIRKWQRKSIVIEGVPTVELDYRSNHLYFLYGLENQSISDLYYNDPYDLGNGIPREIYKSVFMILLNVRAPSGAWNAMRNSFIDKDSNQTELFNKHLPDNDAFKGIVRTLIDKHPIIEGYLYRSFGGDLMYMDSKIAEFVLMTMTYQNIPCLSIHDSFVVPEGKEYQLKEAMKEAYNYVGYPKGLPPIKRV